MLGLRWIGVLALGLCACSPQSAPAGTGGTAADDDDTGASSSDPNTTAATDPGTSGAPDTDAMSAGTAETGGGDGSHETDYPVEPGCEEGDEGYSEYDDPPIGGSSGADDTGVGMGGDFPLSATVFEIQTGLFTGGAFVELTNVVVTTPPSSSPDGDERWVFVQEPEGGANSGILLRILSGTPETEALLPGDRITVRGDFIERYVFASIEIENAETSIDYGEPGAIPDPVLVTPAAVSPGWEMAEELESVLVQVEEVQVVDPSVCAGEVLVQATLKLDDRFLAEAGEAIPAPPTGTYTSVRGPLIYTYNGFEIAPRSLADIVF